MDENGVYDVCDLFGLRSASPHGGSRGDQISISCPLAAKNHGDPDDWNLSCSVSLDGDGPSMARCFSWNCGWKGSFFRMLTEAASERGNPPNIVAYLAKIEPTEKIGLQSTLARSLKRWSHNAQAQRACVSIHAPDQDLMAEGRMDRFKSGIPKYAVTRGVTIETARAWDLGHDVPNRRLVFAIRRWDKKLVGISGRDYTGKAENKYHNYAGLDKSRYLYGEHMLRKGDPTIICEGQLDAIITWQHVGLPCVASLGEGFSNHHAKTLAAHRPPWVAIFPDHDAAGHLAAQKIIRQIHGRFPVYFMLPPEGLDPADLTEEQTKRALANKVRLHSQSIPWPS